MSGARHIPRVHVPAPLAVGAEIALPDDKRHHLVTVLRLTGGAAVVLFNGDGHEYDAVIATADRRHALVRIEAARRPRRESCLAVTLIQAVARGDRMDFALAKAVELGATAIHPVLAARGRVRLDDTRRDKKQAHWEKVAESAAEQSGRLVCPPVAPVVSLADCLAEPPPADCHLMLAPGAARGLAGLPRARRVALLVGPESGLAEQEIARAEATGWQSLALGPRVLRTETAGMAALAALQTAWGDLAC